MLVFFMLAAYHLPPTTQISCGAICHTLTMHRTTILLPDDLDRRLSAAARRRRRSRSDMLREALASFLEQEARPRPKSIGLGRRLDKRVTSENVKQKIRAEWRDRRHDG